VIWLWFCWVVMLELASPDTHGCSDGGCRREVRAGMEIALYPSLSREAARFAGRRGELRIELEEVK